MTEYKGPYDTRFGGIKLAAHLFGAALLAAVLSVVGIVGECLLLQLLFA